jgi:hypothetical protein
MYGYFGAVCIIKILCLPTRPFCCAEIVAESSIGCGLLDYCQIKRALQYTSLNSQVKFYFASAPFLLSTQTLLCQ